MLRQGFELCAARDRPLEPAAGAIERQLEPLLPGFVCASAAMQRVADQIQRLQGNDLTVLITGESGTGKDLVARAIHAGSPRGAAMFLPYNCTSATRELADSQLFGHRRGSFTGAVADQPGLMRTAVGGTLFLDEIGDLPIDVQPKLLRFLEQGEILPVGETRPTRVDVRVVAATNADLEQRVAEGKFREDLFYRLSVIRIHVPPLRERREEIPHLSTFFLREASERLGKPDVRLSPDTLDLFDAFSWPGNVRQLRNEIQRAVAMAGGSLITPDLLSPVFGSAGLSTEGTRGRNRSVTLGEAVERLEREMIENALERATGNISQTARFLGLTRRGLYLKMARLGIPAQRIARRSLITWYTRIQPAWIRCIRHRSFGSSEMSLVKSLNNKLVVTSCRLAEHESPTGSVLDMSSGIRRNPTWNSDFVWCRVDNLERDKRTAERRNLAVPGQIVWKDGQGDDAAGVGGHARRQRARRGGRVPQWRGHSLVSSGVFPDRSRRAAPPGSAGSAAKTERAFSGVPRRALQPGDRRAVGICAPPPRRARPPRRQHRGRARRMGLAGTNAHGLIRHGWGLALPGRPRSASHAPRHPTASSPRGTSAGARSLAYSCPTAKRRGYLLLTCIDARCRRPPLAPAAAHPVPKPGHPPWRPGLQSVAHRKRGFHD